MFFMMGITQGRKDIDFNQTVICNICGQYGRYQLFMTYTVLSLFFIPCFKWNRRYYVQMSCCNAVYELDPDIGKRIARGEQIDIRPEYLHRAGSGNYGYTVKRCRNCGFQTDEVFEYCPKCGIRV